VTAAGGTITLLVSAALLRLGLTDAYQRYVREELGPFLVAAGAALLVLGVVTLVRALRKNGDDDHGDDHSEGLGAGWLLLAPIAALLLVAPPTLGSFGVDHAAAVVIRPGDRVFDRLPRGQDPVPMTLLEFNQRAFDHGGSSFNRAPVELAGFVADDAPGGFRLARYQIACCAADAAPVVVDVTGIRGEVPPRDQWLVVTGLFTSHGHGDVPELAATSVVAIDAPEDPYE
jgi:uncharacterized repeat protein (TIGR03943 family)